MRLEGLIAELNSIADFSGLQAGIADAEGSVLYAPAAGTPDIRTGEKLPASGFVTLPLPFRDGHPLMLFARGTEDPAGNAAVLQALKLVAGRLSDRTGHESTAPELLAAVLEKRPGSGVKKLETLLGAAENGSVYRLLIARSDADKEDKEQAESPDIEDLIVNRRKAEARIKELTDVLGIFGGDDEEEGLGDDIQALIDERQAARKEKNWARADEIRDQLAAMGITLKDTPQGVQVIRN